MKKNFSNYKINNNSNRNANTLNFIDITYKFKPKSKFRHKLVVILGLDILLSKSVIYCFALIVG